MGSFIRMSSQWLALCFLLLLLPRPGRTKEAAETEQSEKKTNEKETERRSQANTYQALLAKATKIGRKCELLIIVYPSLTTIK